MGAEIEKPPPHKAGEILFRLTDLEILVAHAGGQPRSWRGNQGVECAANVTSEPVGSSVEEIQNHSL